MITISKMDLFHLRLAAALWLAEHMSNPNAQDVTTALLNTNLPE